jgi:hypothetical protein
VFVFFASALVLAVLVFVFLGDLRTFFMVRLLATIYYMSSFISIFENCSFCHINYIYYSHRRI